MSAKSRTVSLKGFSIFLFIMIIFSAFQLSVRAEESSTGIVLEENKISITAGKSFQLKWKVLPSSASQAATFYSKNTKIANVSEGGRVIGMSEGNTEIVVTSTDGRNFCTCQVTVTKNAETEIIELADTELLLRTESSSTLFFNYNKDEYVFTKTAVFTSSDNDVATVNENGTIKAKNAGNATITATFGKTVRECKVNIGDSSNHIYGRKISGILLDSNNHTYKNQLIAISTKYNNKLYYATVKTDNMGKFTFSGIKDGNYTIVYYNQNTKKLIHSDTVKIAGKDKAITCILNKNTMLAMNGEFKTEENTIPKSVSLENEYLSMNIGDIKSLQIATVPRDADLSKLKAASSNPDVVDINDKGEIVAVSDGYADITYTTPDGKSTAICRITVLESESSHYSLLIMAAILVAVLLVLLYFIRYYKKFQLQKKLREDIYE